MHHGVLTFKQKQREEQAEPDGTEGIYIIIFTIIIISSSSISTVVVIVMK